MLHTIRYASTRARIWIPYPKNQYPASRKCQRSVPSGGADEMGSMEISCLPPVEPVGHPWYSSLLSVADRCIKSTPGYGNRTRNLAPAYPQRHSKPDRRWYVTVTPSYAIADRNTHTSGGVTTLQPLSIYCYVRQNVTAP